MTLPFFDYASVTLHEREHLERTFGGFTTLAQVLDWGRHVDPMIEVDEIITQDEYTHDVLVRLTESRYLNFAMT